MNISPHPKPFGPAINRIADIMAHTDRYSGLGIARLAADAGISRSAVSRLINGKANPTFFTVCRVANALERELGFRLDVRDLICEWGAFPTEFACDVAHCRGCLPPSAHDSEGSITPAFAATIPGEWVASKFPTGYEPGKGGQ